MKLLHGVGDFFALDIGTNTIRLLQLSGDAQKGWTLQKYAYVPVEPAVIQDSSEVGRKKLAEVITGAVQQAGIKTKNVALGLPAGKTYTAVIEVPNQKKEEIEKTIKYEVDQYIPMAVDEAEFGYAVLGTSPNDPAKAEVLLSSTAMNYAEEQMEMLEEAGLNVIAQEPEPIAMTRALSPIGVKEARMIIDLGEKATDLVVTYQEMPRLVRSVPGGLLSLVRTVATALSVREDQARQFILRFGLAQDQLEGQVYKALDGVLGDFAMELAKSVKFFQTKYANAPVGEIILSGFAGVIPDMSKYIEEKTKIAATRGNPWQRVQMTQEQQQALVNVANEFAVAIGLAERSND